MLLGIAISAPLVPIASASKHRVQKVKIVKITKYKVTGQTTKGARITILSFKSKKLASGKSDAKGKFKIKTKHNLKHVGFKLKVTKKGYVSRTSVYHPKKHKAKTIKSNKTKLVAPVQSTVNKSVENSNVAASQTNVGGNFGLHFVTNHKPDAGDDFNKPSVVKPKPQPEEPSKRPLTPLERQQVSDLQGDVSYWEEIKFTNENWMSYDQQRLNKSPLMLAYLKDEYDKAHNEFDYQSQHNGGKAMEAQSRMDALSQAIDDENNFVKNYDTVYHRRLLNIAKAKTELNKVNAQLDEYRKITDEFV